MALYNDPNVQSLGINVFAGASSGVIGAAFGSPFFLVKTRLQSYSPHLPVGTQHRYRNLLDGARQIYGSEGFGGLYRGVGAAMVRTGCGSSVQLPTYFFAKRRLTRHLGMEEGPGLHLASSAVSGFVVCCFMHPPGMLTQTIIPSQCMPCSNIDHVTLQIPSCRDCTTRLETFIRGCLTACTRQLAQKVYSQSTRVSLLTWPVSSLTLYVPFQMELY